MDASDSLTVGRMRLDLFDDPQRGHESLAFASLLMRILEIAKVNPIT
jgi:hypothetical protein